MQEKKKKLPGEGEGGAETTHTSLKLHKKKASKVQLELIDSKPGKSESEPKLLRSHVVFIWPKKNKTNKKRCACNTFIL